MNVSQSSEASPLSRRQFVGRLLTAGAGTVLVANGGIYSQELFAAGRKPGEPQAKSESDRGLPHDEKLGWAVAGLGDFGQGYALPALARAKYSKPVALVSGSPEKAKRVAAQYQIADQALYNYESMRGLKDNKEVSVVYVITPNSTHADLTIKALEAGKHVLCEKPMANSPADCQRMIDAAKAANRKLMVAYRVHFEPNNLKAKELIDAGKLGKVSYATSDHHRPLELNLPRDAWRMKKAMAGGGSLVDIGVYSLNGLIWLLGESPSEVSGRTFATPNDPRFKEVENVFTAQLRFPSGRLANISSGYDATRKRADIFGSEATITLDPATSYSGNKLYLSDKEGQPKVFAEEDSAAQFTGEIDHLSQAILRDTPVKTPGEMGLRDVHILHALYESAQTGRWVKLQPDGSARL